MKSTIVKIPIIGPFLRFLYKSYVSKDPTFVDSKDYWDTRYKRGGDSGVGSYGHLAEFKAEFLNQFVATNNISSIIEYGCGDGNQLRMSSYPQYIGFDVSEHAIKRCQKLFHDDKTKSFRLVSNYAGETAQLTMSLDVIYHLVEDSVFESYITRLFDSSTEFVIIYSSDVDSDPNTSSMHVKHRQFSKWVEAFRTDWQLIDRIENKHKFSETVKVGSVCDFFVYRKVR